MKWREGHGGPFLRTAWGSIVARVNYTGRLWRGTVWTRAGTSSATWKTIREAMSWCEGEVE